jgi:Family of unknown function (DUF5993)
MMAGLFLLMCVVSALIYGGQWRGCIILLLVTLALMWLMLYHHATSTLGIKW